MGEAFRDLKDEIGYMRDRVHARKQAQVLEHIKEIRGEWARSPVLVTIEPAFFASSRLPDLKDLKSPDDFKKAYPKLEMALGEDKYRNVSPLILGNIHIGARKTDGGGGFVDYMREGKQLLMAGVELLKDVQAALKELAHEIEKGEKPLSDVDYFIGLSRLGSVAGHLGFDTFPLSDNVKKEHQSHKLAQESNELSGMSEERAKEQATKRPATLAIISAKRLTELYGS